MSFTILHDYDRMLVDECPRIIQDTAQANLNNILRENKYETAIISEDYRLPLIQNSFLNHSKSSGSFLIKTTTRPEVYLKKYSLIQKSILEKSLEVIGGRKFDFILIDLPALERVASTGSFAQAVDAVQYLDNFLDQIKEKSLECGYSLLFSSLYGLAEKISVVRKPVSGYSFVATTKSPLPLVLIESGLANQNTNDLHDVFHSAGRSYDLHNLILNLFSIGSDDKCKVYKKLYKSN